MLTGTRAACLPLAPDQLVTRVARARTAAVVQHHSPLKLGCALVNSIGVWLRGVLHRWLKLRGTGRHPMQQRMGVRGSMHAISPDEGTRLARGARWPIERLFAELHAHPLGLTEREATARARRYGPNALPREPAWYRWLQPLRSVASPFNLLLALLAALAWLADDARAAGVIGVMVLLSGVLRLFQEQRAQTALARLAKMVHSTSTVLRRPATHGAEAQPRSIELAIEALVPGDIVLLAAGDIVPADCRLIDSRQLFVAQASLTGESLPVEKDAQHGDPPAAGLLTEPALVFQGTTVVSGAASALVLATGSSTLFGSLALSAVSQHSASEPLQQEMNRIGILLLGIASVMVPLVFLVNGLLRDDWGGAFLFALSVAVGLTPEMLPMVVTAALAKGAVDLSRRQVVVRRLDAIQALGAMDVLCIDKTGTLTEDRIVLDRHLDAAGNESDDVYQLAWLNSRYQTGLRSALDRAVLGHADARSSALSDTRWRPLDEIPFDFERRRLSVVLEGDGAGRRLICKGAVEEVLGCCTRVRLPGSDRLLDEAERAAARARVAALERDGLRVVAIAERPIDQSQIRFGRDDEANLTLAGFIAFLDPPRESAAPALDALAAHGIRIIVLTGDSETVAASVCARVGLHSPSILTGAQVDAMQDEELARAFDQARVAARLTPHQKERIVAVLRHVGHTVGFLGDGINDAPALRAADVGISVDTAVDIAREAADVVLLEKNLLVIDAGVMLGRAALCNMNRYLRMAASSNFGNVLSVLVASAFLPFLPMLPIQLLVQNLLYDLSQAALPFDRVEPELVAAPRRWDPGEFKRFMLMSGPVSSLFDLFAFGVLAGVLQVATVEHQALFQSAWLMLGLATQVLVVQLMRAPELPLRRQRAAWPVTLASLAVLLAGLWLPFGPLAAVFGLAPPPPAWFAWMALLLVGYLVVMMPVRRRLAAVAHQH